MASLYVHNYILRRTRLQVLRAPVIGYITTLTQAFNSKHKNSRLRTIWRSVTQFPQSLARKALMVMTLMGVSPWKMGTKGLLRARNPNGGEIFVYTIQGCFPLRGTLRAEQNFSLSVHFHVELMPLRSKIPPSGK